MIRAKGHKSKGHLFYLRTRSQNAHFAAAKHQFFGCHIFLPGTLKYMSVLLWKRKTYTPNSQTGSHVMKNANNAKKVYAPDQSSCPSINCCDLRPASQKKVEFKCLEFVPLQRWPQPPWPVGFFSVSLPPTSLPSRKSHILLVSSSKSRTLRASALSWAPF